MSRALKFRLLGFAVPLGIVLLKILARTWRLDSAEMQELQKTFGKHPRIAIAIWHNSSLAIIPLAAKARAMGRSTCIMTSPSRDGMLLDRVITSLGLTIVKGSSSSKPVSATRALTTVLRGGTIGLIAVDGPRGPRLVAKPGLAMIASHADAQVICLSAGASRAFKFRSWDRLYLPAPFAKLSFKCREIALGNGDKEDLIRVTKEMQEALMEDSRAVNSPGVIGEKPA